MGQTAHVFHLIGKDLLLEWRQKYALGGILLYVVSTVFLIYIVLNQGGLLDRLGFKFWSAFFWVTILFASVNALTKSFIQESNERQLYYYTLVSPQVVILSKMVYNLFLMLLLALLGYGAFALMIANPVVQLPIFLLVLLLGGAGLSFTLTMVSAIAAKAQNNITLMAVLSFPILLPLLLLIQKMTQYAFLANVDVTSLWKDSIVLLAFDGMIVVLSYLLFPFLWRD